MHRVLRIGPDHFSMSGLAEKGEVEEAFGIKMPEGDYNSIGGFMCMSIDRIPAIGEAATVETAAERIRFEISSVDDRRVLQVEAFRTSKEAEEEMEEEEKEEASHALKALKPFVPPASSIDGASLLSGLMPF